MNDATSPLPSDEPNDCPPCRVLLLADHRTDFSRIRQLLEPLRCTVIAPDDLDEPPCVAIVAGDLSRWALLRSELASVPSLFIAPHNSSLELIGLMYNLGANDVIRRPVSRSRLVRHLRMQMPGRFVPGGHIDAPEEVLRCPRMIAAAPDPRQWFARAAKLAAGDAPLLLAGPRGTGKHLLAARLHFLSARRGPFVAFRLQAQWPEEALEELLFGHGNGHREPWEGLISRSAGGTLYLADTTEIQPRIQARLLSVIENRHLDTEGTLHTPRIVFGSSRDLAAMVQRDAFRSDLYYRLSSRTIPLCGLAESGADFGMLFERFIAEAAWACQRTPPTLDAGVRQWIAGQPMPNQLDDLEQLAWDTVQCCNGEPDTVDTDRIATLWPC